MAKITVGKTRIAIENGTYLDALKLQRERPGVYRGVRYPAGYAAAGLHDYAHHLRTRRAADLRGRVMVLWRHTRVYSRSGNILPRAVNLLKIAFLSNS
jgi:hypothetical protein